MGQSKAEEKVLATQEHADLQYPYSGFIAHPGEYHMIRVDKKGAEIKGSDFSVGERTYLKTYAKRGDFKVKKNPNQ